MTKYTIFIFDKIRDELFFQVQNEKTSIYKSSRKMSFNNECHWFYLIRHQQDSEDVLASSMRSLFSEEDNFLECSSRDHLPPEDPESVILIMTKPSGCDSYYGKSRIYDIQNSHVGEKVIEIDIEKSKRRDFPSFFDDNNSIICCEEFRKISVAELLDIEI